LNTIVTETTEQGEIPVDVYQKLANDRILFVTGKIDDKLATDIAATLLAKDAEDSDKKITLFINSEGGDIQNVFMIYDMMSIISAPIETVCIGYAFDEAAVLLASGSPGRRFATKNSFICIGPLVHNWMSMSDLTDAKSILDRSVQNNKRMMDIISKRSNKSLKEVMENFERETFMNVNQAIKYGIIDKIVNTTK
jgi:ATP-dependent Clp protease protease subunit